MKAVIASVRHSGTGFARSLIERSKFTGAIIAEHVYYDRPSLNPRLINHLDQGVIIVPLRHPYCVEKSWVDMARPMNLLTELSILVHELDNYHPYYLPLDSPHKTLFLEMLEDAVGVELSTDWQPVDQRNGNAKCDPDMLKPSQKMITFVQENQTFFNRFYP